jgi:5-methylcytosine-specific restriction endonuclease McrA
MDRAVLEGWIAEGLSLDAMGRRAGRHPSTVAYWLGKHGLRAVHAEAHAARGALAEPELRELIDAGLSVRDIARDMGRSAATVRHWLRVHGLETRLTAARRLVAAAAGQDLELACRRHGRTAFRARSSDGQYRCLRCQSEQVIERRRRLRAQLVAEAGGACAICGYDRYVGALHFHHLDPATKRFALGGGATRSIERNRAEAAKCVLLCSNCHAEVEAGLKPAARPVVTVSGGIPSGPRNGPG